MKLWVDVSVSLRGGWWVAAYYGGRLLMVGEWSLDMRMQPGPRRTVGKSRLATCLGSLYLCCVPQAPQALQAAAANHGPNHRGVELFMPWVTRKGPEGTICLLINFLQLSSWATEAPT